VPEPQVALHVLQALHPPATDPWQDWDVAGAVPAQLELATTVPELEVQVTVRVCVPVPQVPAAEHVVQAPVDQV